MGGVTTFLAMAYIISVNPGILAAAGVPFSAGLTATCLGAAVMTLAMGLVSNRHIALAAGMGLNAVVAYTLCQEMGFDWRVGMSVVFLEGIVILALVLCGLRKAIMDAIPVSLRLAISVGIGLFIAFIGMKGGGIIVANQSSLVALGDLTSPTCVVAIVSILLAIVLVASNVPGALLISIGASCLLGIPLGVTSVPTEWSFSLDFSTFAAPFQTDPATGSMALLQVLTHPSLLMFVFSLVMSDFFDTMGTVVAIGRQGDFCDDEGNVEDIQPILVVDSVAASVGGFLGGSSVTTYVESAAGVAVGARTGLANVVTAALFVASAFLSPLMGMVGASATCGALVVVGYLMMNSIADIDWSKVEFAFPSFLTIATIPFTYSITNGIGLGFISYVVLMVAMGRVREVRPLMWVSAAAFLLLFMFA